VPTQPFRATQQLATSCANFLRVSSFSLSVNLSSSPFVPLSSQPLHLPAGGSKRPKTRSRYKTITPSTFTHSTKIKTSARLQKSRGALSSSKTRKTTRGNLSSFRLSTAVAWVWIRLARRSHQAYNLDQTLGLRSDIPTNQLIYSQHKGAKQSFSYSPRVAGIAYLRKPYTSRASLGPNYSTKSLALYLLASASPHCDFLRITTRAIPRNPKL